MSGTLLHVALGGTISMQPRDGLLVPALGAADLAAVLDPPVTPVDVAAVGGPQLDFPTLVRAHSVIRRGAADGATGAIVTLGTDAIEEVSAFFAFSGPWPLNVVITGAMQPGVGPGSDGLLNLGHAAAVARGQRLSEPVVVFAGRMMLARTALKVSGTELDAFASPTEPTLRVADVIAADGAGTGAGVWDGPPPPVPGAPGEHTLEVPILTSALSIGAAGAEPPLPDALPALVCASSGAGNLTPEVARAATRALASGTVVAIATRAFDHRMAPGYGYPGGSGVLADAGAILAAGLSAHKLRMFLLVALSRGLQGAELRRTLTAFLAATAAELTPSAL
ncbi:MAG TPA: asparaginase [Solirubrobacteraceae bacterium]|nr:asparaginase [Solirubrobacteraceae bacterium]